MNVVYNNILFTLSGFKCIEIDRDDDETDLEATTTGTETAPNENELPPSVVDAALTPSLTKTSQISATQARCLDMQTQQHEAEMELLVFKKNLIITYKRNMEVLDAERPAIAELKYIMLSGVVEGGGGGSGGLSPPC